MLKILTLFMLSFSSVYAIHNATLNINEYDLEAGIKFDIGQFNTTVEPNTTFLGITYLKAGSKNDSSASNDIDGYLNVNFMVKQNIRNTGFNVGLGFKGVYTSFLEADFIALPIGAEVGYKLPFRLVIPIRINAVAYYAPKSLSFFDADNYLEYRLEVSADLMDRASVYIGFRKIDTSYENQKPDYTYNESGYFGMKFSF